MQFSAKPVIWWTPVTFAKTPYRPAIWIVPGVQRFANLWLCFLVLFAQRKKHEKRPFRRELRGSANLESAHRSHQKKDKTPETSKRKPEKGEKGGKKWKKGLTKGEESGNIIKLRKGAGARKARRDKKSAEKKQKNATWSERKCRKETRKKFWKPLDKRNWVWYTIQAVAKSGNKPVPWKLNNERRENKARNVERRTKELVKFQRSTHNLITNCDTQGKVKERIKLEKVNSGTKYREIFYSRVWSWLRMNAGGVLNTFKSYELILKLASEES